MERSGVMVCGVCLVYMCWWMYESLPLMGILSWSMAPTMTLNLPCLHNGHFLHPSNSPVCAAFVISANVHSWCGQIFSCKTPVFVLAFSPGRCKTFLYKNKIKINIWGKNEYCSVCSFNFKVVSDSLAQSLCSQRTK